MRTREHPDRRPAWLAPGEKVLSRRELAALPEHIAGAYRLADRMNRPRRFRWCWNCRVGLAWGMALCSDCLRALVVGALSAAAAAALAWWKS